MELKLSLDMYLNSRNMAHTIPSWSIEFSHWEAHFTAQ
jgi:hypothetical protein